MRDPKILDRLVLADFLLAILSVASSAASGSAPAPGLTFALWVLVCGTTVVAWIGLLQRLRAGRALYAASWVGYLALVALRAGGADAGLDRLLDLATGLVGGMILGLVYLSDFRAEFLPFRAARADTQPAR